MERGRYYFSTSYDPEFPNIRACIKKHEKILEENPELKELFPSARSKFWGVVRVEGQG